MTEVIDEISTIKSNESFFKHFMRLSVPVNLGKEIGYSIVKFLNSYYNLSKPK